jgi:hypothetical protein
MDRFEDTVMAHDDIPDGGGSHRWILGRQEMKNHIWQNKYTILSAIIFWLIVGPGLGRGFETLFYSWYDTANPVVSFTGSIVSKSKSEVVIHIAGRKNRACTFVDGSFQSYAVRNGVLHSAYEQKFEAIDGSRPVGPADVGTFKIWPVEGAEAVRVFVQHDCDGRIVQTKIADVRLI